MHKTTSFFFTLLAFVSLIAYGVPATADDTLYVPKSLPAQLSADGNTLYNGASILALVVDPNPSTLRKIPAPAFILSPPEQATASFSITYISDGGTDAWGERCYTFPEKAKAAFNAAADIWANTLSSKVPITINACWADLGSSSTLGYSGGQPLRKDFTGATQSNTWYSGSLANALNGSDLDPSRYDMHITYNRNFTWYYGTDGNTPSTQMDLVSVVLHEICHGLNFSGSMSYSGGKGSWGYGTGYPNIYDVFIRDGSGTPLIDTGSYTNGSTALGAALTSNNIWFHGTRAMAANGNQPVKMYAPSIWRSGSSYSHLDYNTFNNTSNQLMVYAISAGESIHDPGAVTNGLLKDLGWQSGSSTISIGEAVDNTALTWSTGGNADWYGQTAVFYYGGDAAQSGAITHNGTSWVQTTMTGPGTVNFHWKVSSEANYDHLKFYIDTAEQTRISGTVDWQQKTYAIGSGSHTLKWAYEKDTSVSTGNDAGWLDKVVSTTVNCPDCPADGIITNVTYPAGTTCSCSNATAITLGSKVLVKSGAMVTFTAPTITLQNGFHAENGSTVNIKQK